MQVVSHQYTGAGEFDLKFWEYLAKRADISGYPIAGGDHHSVLLDCPEGP